MEITKSKRIIINEIMYSFSIATTSFRGDDSITAQLLHCFQSYLCRISPTKILYNIFHIFSTSFCKKQKRFYKTFDSFYKIPNVIYNMWNFATQPIMHIKMPLQFNFSLRFQRKVRSTENRVIGESNKVYRTSPHLINYSLESFKL